MQGGPGRSADAPIDLEDDAPRASNDQKPRVGAVPPADDLDAREAALLVSPPAALTPLRSTHPLIPALTSSSRVIGGTRTTPEQETQGFGIDRGL